MPEGIFGFADRRRPVTPAKAEVQVGESCIGSCLRRNDMPEDMSAIDDRQWPVTPAKAGVQ
jgi:hypothetical protein